MKGYVFTVNKGVPIGEILSRGYFGVRLTESPAALYATLADFTSFQAGQRVFFFQERWLYGVGELVSAQEGGPLRHNFPDADAHWLTPPQVPPEERTAFVTSAEDARWNEIAFFFAFKSSPYLFERGIDMDEALSTLNFDAWGLRFMSGKSFFELNDTDTETLTRIFMRRFANSGKTLAGEARPDPFTAKVAARIQEMDLAPFNLTESVVKANRFAKPRVGRVDNENILHGMFIEAMRENLDFLPPSREGLVRTGMFHELPASPAKPADYADSIDVFCTLAAPENHDVPLHFEIVELKSGPLPWSGETAATHLAQVMKYVDFIARYYAGGNFAAISAYLIASDFSVDFTELLPEIAQRTYVLDPHDVSEPTRKWSALSLKRYRWDATSRKIMLIQV